MSNNASANHLYRTKPQRLCSSEHSSPQSERRKDQIISSNHTNGEPSSFPNVTSATNINEKINSNVPVMTYELNSHGQNHDNVKETLVHSNNLNDKRPSSEDCNVSEFAQVSEDMNELVYHLNSIQNDISELAGKSISLTCENKT